ncbi:ABC transporter ATP-binding protein [Verrucomicrobia bacterium]|nr:ABC transporter ATP-binding protein [Verrucomicrobiota bacterium]
MDKTIIEVKNLTKRYSLGSIGFVTFANDVRKLLNKWGIRLGIPNKSEEFLALDKISFSVKKGEVIGIIGANGAGKSTLLKILSRITEPSSGQASITGRVASLLEVGTGFHEDMTGRENIYLNGSLYGLTRKEIERKLPSIIEFSQIEKFIDTPVKRYSSGMYVRLAFAVAAHLEPEILIVDEVLAVGDAEFQKKCIGKMKKVSDSGRTVLFVSHQLNMIRNLCTRCIMLENGKIKHDGEVEETLRKYLSGSSDKKGIAISERTDRRGKNNYIVQDITFLGIEKNDRTILCGSDIEITVKVVSKIPFETNIQCAIAIFDNNGNILTDLSNFFTNDSLIPGKQNCFEIKCRLSEVNLNAGTYRYNCWLSTDIELEDHVLNAGTFIINEGNFFFTGKSLPLNKGSVLLNQKWIIST